MGDIPPYLAIGISAGLVYALLALGIVLVYKGSRVLNFAHPYFGLVGAFVCWWLTDKASFAPFSWLPFEANSLKRLALAIPLSILFVALYGAAVEHGVMRRLRNRSRLLQLVATIALAQGAVGFVQLIFNRTDEQAAAPKFIPVLLPQGWSFDIGTRRVTPAEIQILIVVPIICIVAAIFFTRTRFGVAVRAAAENAEAARLVGISANRVSAFVWITGAVLAALAGILITMNRGSLDVASLSTGFLVRGITAALVGGLTSLPGAVVGGLIVGVSESLLTLATDNQAGASEVLLFILVIAFLVFRPGGLFGQREDTEDKVAFVPAIRELSARLRDSAAARGVRVLGGILLAFACLLSLVAGSATNDILTYVVILAIVGVSLTVLIGYSGQISLGHWGLAGVGAFALANLTVRANVPYVLALPIVVVAGMLVSLVIGLPALRIRGLYLAVATLSFNLAAEFFIFKDDRVAQGTAGIIIDRPKIGPLNLGSTTGRPMFFFSVFLLLLSMLVVRNLSRTRTGRGFYAIRENEKAAATLGVPLTQYKLLAFAVSGGIAAIAGALHATNLGKTDVTMWQTETSLILVSLVLIGGLGYLTGPLFGAFLIAGLPQLVHFENLWIVPIGSGILLLIVLLRTPGGVAGAVARVREGLVKSLDDMAQQQQQAAPPPAPTSTRP